MRHTTFKAYHIPIDLRNTPVHISISVRESSFLRSTMDFLLHFHTGMCMMNPFKARGRNNLLGCSLGWWTHGVQTVQLQPPQCCTLIRVGWGTVDLNAPASGCHYRPSRELAENSGYWYLVEISDWMKQTPQRTAWWRTLLPACLVHTQYILREKTAGGDKNAVEYHQGTQTSRLLSIFTGSEHHLWIQYRHMLASRKG